jgi:hypothetical protein
MAESAESSLTSVNSIASSLSSIHESPSLHCCPINSCGKAFSKKYNLKAHLRLHTGEQPFCCSRPNCGKKFKWRSSLSSHSVWHTRQASNSEATCALGQSELPTNGQRASKNESPSTKLKALQQSNASIIDFTSHQSITPEIISIDLKGPSETPSQAQESKRLKSIQDLINGIPHIAVSEGFLSSTQQRSSDRFPFANKNGKPSIATKSKSDQRKRRTRCSGVDETSGFPTKRRNIAEQIPFTSELNTTSYFTDTIILSPISVTDEKIGSPLSLRHDVTVFEFDSMLPQELPSNLSFSSSPVLADFQADFRFGPFELDNFQSFETRLEFNF